MLIDSFLPEYDFRETHDIKIRATAETVFRALNRVDLCDSLAVRCLFRLRGLPTRRVTLREMKRLRFEVLGESENRELLLGLAGRFWTMTAICGKLIRKIFENSPREVLPKPSGISRSLKRRAKLI